MAAAMRGGQRTMADVSRSLPSLAQQPATASPSQPAAPPAASNQATAADLDQATPKAGALEVANFLQARLDRSRRHGWLRILQAEEIQQIKEQLLAS
ncbi:hypothetical protein MRX96_050558 [Rhipicephalus microplus]